jgi:hypothetical protein
MFQKASYKNIFDLKSFWFLDSIVLKELQLLVVGNEFILICVESFLTIVRYEFSIIHYVICGVLWKIFTHSGLFIVWSVP